MKRSHKRIVVLISGRGTNMAALIEAVGERDFPAEIVGVISDQPEALGLAFAAAKGIPVKALPRGDFPSREAHDQALDATIHAFGGEMVCLAGYMRLLTTAFVEEWQGRMINIHPALLPLFKGLDTHRRALDAGVRLHGCTVHFVTPKMDDGPIIAQAAVPVMPGDTEERLSARVLKAEHRLYPMALRLLVEGKVRMQDGQAIFDPPSGSVSPDASLFSLSASATEIDVEALARFTP